ncbi:response regulator [Natronogracilivirga saccharolytica]|uniref:Response regulator n=1 Tax=Natronogracilivirga saccharolytica TaxID=2812953 RepID=A0A8J7UWU1_9BACT|nr:response regulator [Natronogracilivirga saccharolytica]MBP3193997.1 response regulator [Natronogracilivirga saccharolytica]
MTNLLIHSNNTSLLELKDFQENNLIFKIPTEKDVDHYISDLITEQIEPVNPDVIFVKYALDNDYLALLGLRLAHHIRLQNSSNDFHNVPIVFVGEETLSELIRLSEYSDILATPGVYYVNEDLGKVRVLLDRIIQDSGLKGLESRDSYFKKINIPAPLNYDSRHNYINELSLFLWSEYIGYAKLNNDIQNRIRHNLYFKYRIEKDKIDREKKSIGNLPVFDIQSKILLIDDEAEKGWDKFYKHLFSSSTDKIECHVAEFDKSSSKDEIIDDCMEKIEGYKPDVILLDLRLSEKDAFESVPQFLTGYLLLEKIKEFNRGIQVIVTTASNKTSIYRELNNIGADDYVIKNERPEESCPNLIEALKIAINESKILKPIHSSLILSIESVQNNQLRKINIGEDSNYFYQELKSEINAYLIAIQGLISKRDNIDRFSITLLYMHKILEALSDYYIEIIRPQAGVGSSSNYQDSFYSGEKTYYFIKGHNNEFRVIDRDFSKPINVLQQFYNLYYYFTNRSKTNLFEELESLNSYRNSYSHPNLDEEFTKLEKLYVSDFKSFRKSFIRQTTAFFEYLTALR